MSAIRPLRFALLGDPVVHSKSPAMHAAAYAALGLPHTYEAIRATPGDLHRLFIELENGTFAGFNVTVPLKRAVLPHVRTSAPTALLVGAANTIVNKAPFGVIAHNTDVPALAAELRALAPEVTDWSGTRALVLGAGGVARAAVVALRSDLGVSEVVVRARKPGGLEDLNVGTIQPLSPVGPAGRAGPATDFRFDVVVQATSAGMIGADSGDELASVVDWHMLPDRAVVLETIYAPAETPFLRAARDRSLRSANGLGMLARQGALAFEIWLEQEAPLDVMLAAIS
jgi:shikimate dehydrogenase